MSIRHEEAIVGAALLTPRALDDALNVGLEPAHFTSKELGGIYSALVDMRAAGEQLDPVTVGERLPGVRASRLINLQVGCPATSNASRYARAIKGDFT